MGYAELLERKGDDWICGLPVSVGARMRLFPVTILSIIVVGCANYRYISHLKYYQEGSRDPILFGSITGLPYDYSLDLSLDYVKPNGEVIAASREIRFEEGDDVRDRLLHFAFSPPPGALIITGLEFRAVKFYEKRQKRGPVRRAAQFQFKLIDTLSVRIEAEQKRLHYLGRWKVTGADAIDSLTAPVLEDFSSVVSLDSFKSECEKAVGISVENRLEEDVGAFRKRNPRFKAKQGSAALAVGSLLEGIRPFDFTVADAGPSSAGHYNYHLFPTPPVPIPIVIPRF